MRQDTFFLGFDRDNPQTHGAYSSTANYIKEWLNLPIETSCPLNLRQRIKTIHSPSSFDVADAIQKAFVKNNAVFHRKCIVRYGKDKLKRKRDEIEKNIDKDPVIPCKVTRRSFVATNFTELCFFCERDTDLISCRTKKLK